ncbi:MAG: hypothetical protein MI746_07215 [Pseudomonadales bacterium]|nr:hypothetical protein [Pseudomonadales bacterium]
MSEEKQTENDPERTLLTLDQLSQTIEVMTSVVNRLRQHLSEQLKAQAEAQKEEEARRAAAEAAIAEKGKSASSKSESKVENKESFVVEIKQQEADPVRKSTKTLH